MAVVLTNNETQFTASATEAATVVHSLLTGVFYDGVTFSVAESGIRSVHGYWKVPIVPSHWPERMYPLYEDVAILEESLREMGANDIILALSDRV